jgi:hypothetical protein
LTLEERLAALEIEHQRVVQELEDVRTRAGCSVYGPLRVLHPATGRPLLEVGFEGHTPVLALFDVCGEPMVSLKSDENGGVLTVHGMAGNPVASLDATEYGGRVLLRSQFESTPAASLHVDDDLAGALALRDRDGRTVVRAGTHASEGEVGILDAATGNCVTALTSQDGKGALVTQDRAREELPLFHYKAETLVAG